MDRTGALPGGKKFKDQLEDIVKGPRTKLVHKTHRDPGGNYWRAPFRRGDVADPAPLITCL